MRKIATKSNGLALPFWILLAVAIFLGANAHLFYVAIRSDPGCVAHLKDRGSAPGEFRAAKSSC
ncbi:hypothetical protein [Ensifer sp. BR816]|uniref:hypothetical protein n=1 Tax=Rhizobium sp. (strain BR816) TaxID=1057002 RepID=UPI00035D9C43|nr:hypothetical protein [Ensifer sp. BR816]